MSIPVMTLDGGGTVTAAELALAFCTSRAPEPVTVRSMLRTGAVLDLEEGAIRMALARLTRDRTLAQPERGAYVIGPKREALSRRVAGWRRLGKATRPWAGDWLCLHRGGEAKLDRRGRREADRTVALRGFREPLPGLFVRPDNLRSSAETLLGEMEELGLGEGCALSVSSAFVGLTEHELIDLYDVQAIETAYGKAISAILHADAALSTLDPEEAAVRTLIIGRSVIRLLTLDPLLPSPMTDEALRNKVVEKMRAFDVLGRDAWAKIG